MIPILFLDNEVCTAKTNINDLSILPISRFHHHTLPDMRSRMSINKDILKRYRSKPNIESGSHLRSLKINPSIVPIHTS
jgi:hypothetical protein